VPSQKVSKHLKLEKGANILITSGRYVGHTTKVTNVDGNVVSFTIKDQPSQTEKQHTYVI
jgi:ribosomal protein S4E